MMSTRDYYDLLGVSRQATSREVREAYRRLARQLWPDLHPRNDFAAGLFEELAEAYRVLSDPRARALYDHLGPRPAGAGAGVAADREARGEDIHCPIEIDLEDALRGVTATVEVTRAARCTACGDAPPGPCPACRGAGCAGCGATGWRAAACATCGGRGTLPRRARIAVRIPPGADTGSEIRVPAEGHAVRGAGRPGDVVVSPRVRPHPFFTRKGDHLECEVPITVPEAALGARIPVPTPDGPVMLTVPPGTQGGQALRVRGRGCPRRDRQGRGDLLVTMRVVIPRNADSTLEAALRALERLLPDNPRGALWGPPGDEP